MALDDDDLPYIHALNREQRWVVLGDERVLPITTFIDAEGNETDEYTEDAVACVAGVGSYWITIRLGHQETFH